MYKRKNMQIAIQTFGYLAVVGGIIIGILLYYHKETPAVWVTFLTIMSLTLSLCLGWQQSIINKKKSAEKPATEKQPEKELTLLFLFENDFTNLLRSGTDAEFEDDKGDKISFKTKEYFDFEAQSKFIGFYIPSTPKTIHILENLPNVYLRFSSKDKVVVESGGLGLQPVNTDELKFSGRVFIYHEDPILEAKKRELYALYERHGLSPQFRGSDYLFKKSVIKSEQDTRPPSPQQPNDSQPEEQATRSNLPVADSYSDFEKTKLKSLEELEAAFQSAKGIYYNKNRDAAYRNLARKALSIDQVQFAIKVSKNIYYNETKDEAFVEIVKYAIDASDIDSANEATKYIYYNTTRDKAKQMIVDAITAKPANQRLK